MQLYQLSPQKAILLFRSVTLVSPTAAAATTTAEDYDQGRSDRKPFIVTLLIFPVLLSLENRH